MLLPFFGLSFIFNLIFKLTNVSIEYMNCSIFVDNLFVFSSVGRGSAASGKIGVVSPKSNISATQTNVQSNMSSSTFSTPKTSNQSGSVKVSQAESPTVDILKKNLFGDKTYSSSVDLIAESGKCVESHFVSQKSLDINKLSSSSLQKSSMLDTSKESLLTSPKKLSEIPASTASLSDSHEYLGSSPKSPVFISPVKSEQTYSCSQSVKSENSSLCSPVSCRDSPDISENDGRNIVMYQHPFETQVAHVMSPVSEEGSSQIYSSSEGRSSRQYSHDNEPSVSLSLRENSSPNQAYVNNSTHDDKMKENNKATNSISNSPMKSNSQSHRSSSSNESMEDFELVEERLRYEELEENLK